MKCKNNNLKIITFVMLFFASHLHADNLLDVYQKTLIFDPGLKQAEAIRLSALEIAPQAKAGLFPVIDFQVNYKSLNKATNYKQEAILDFSERYNTLGVWVGLRQSLLNLSKLNRLKHADVIVAAAEIEYARFYQDLLYRITLAYLEFLAANDSLTEYIIEKNLTGQVLKTVIEQHKKGEVAVVDKHDVQARFDSVTTNINYANTRIEIARETLRKLTGEYFVSLSPLNPEAPFKYPDQGDVTWWVEQALNENYEVLGAVLSIQASALNINYQKTFNYPTIDLIGNYNLYNTQAKNQTEWAVNESVIGIELNWNIYRGGLNSSYINQSRFTQMQKKLSHTVIERDIESRVRASHYLTYTEIARVNDLGRAILSHKQALKANQIAYSLKARKIRDLLISIEQLSKIKRDYAQARYNHLIQYVVLHKLSRMIDDSFVEKINELTVVK